MQRLPHAGVDPLPWIGHYEPTPICYASGSNLITAETGVNPRDTAADTSAHRGMDLTDCRTMLYEAGFTHLCKGDGSLVELTDGYIREHVRRTVSGHKHTHEPSSCVCLCYHSYHERHCAHI